MIKLRSNKGKIKSVPFKKILPNLFTIAGLIIGVSSIRFALDNRWEMSVYCILIATIIDGLDGKVARILGSTSRFGAELDSLCDFVNFGFCPGIIIYLWLGYKYDYKLMSWTCITLFIVCMCLRLARFNVIELDSKNSNNQKYYFFSGVPAPIGALLALVPIMLDFELSSLIHNFNFRNYVMGMDIYIIFVAMLLVSNMPTISLKNLHIKTEYLPLSIVISVVVLTVTVMYTWYVLPIISIAYILSIPACYYWSNNIKDNIT